MEVREAADKWELDVKRLDVSSQEREARMVAAQMVSYTFLRSSAVLKWFQLVTQMVT